MLAQKTNKVLPGNGSRRNCIPNYISTISAVISFTRHSTTELGAKQAGNRARYITEQLALETVNDCIHACGSRALIQPSPLERILRDLSFYVLHDNCDRVLSSIGQEILGQSFDLAYFNTHPTRQENLTE